MKNILTRLLLAFALICSASADFNPGPFKIWDGTDALEIDASGRITVLQGASPWTFTLGTAIPAGTNLIGKFGIDQTTPGTTNLVAAGQSGTWNLNNIAGTVSLPTGAATAAKQPALGTAGASSVDVLSVQGVASGTPLVQNQTQLAGTAISVNNGTTDAGTQRVSISSDSTGQVKLATGANTIGALTANQSVNIAQMNGVTTSMNAGATDTGTQRVVLANESIQDVAVTGFSETSAGSAWNLLASTQTTSATDAIGYRSLAVQVEGIAITSVTATFEGSNDNTNFVSIPMYDRSSPTTAPSAAPALSGSPMHKFFDGPITFRYVRYRFTAITGTSVQAFTKFSTVPFVPSTYQIAAASNWSSNIAQINGVTPLMGNGITGTGSPRVTIASDGTANSNPWLVTLVPSAGQGASTTHHLISAATTNATAVKGSAGTINGGVICNSNAAARFFKLYNKATAPTVGTDTPIMTLLLPPGASTLLPCGQGLRCSTGIAYALTTGIAVADTAAVGTDISVHLSYQ